MISKIGKTDFVKRTMRLKVLITAALLAILPVIALGITSYFVASGNLLREVGNANKQTMSQIQERIDKMLVAVDKTVLQLAYNPTLNHFLTQPNPYENARDFKDVMMILNSMEVLVDDVDSVNLFMKSENLVVSPSQGLTNTDKLDPTVRNLLETADKPLYLLDRKSENKLPRGGSHVVTLIRGLPVYADKYTGYLIININERAFFKMFNGIQPGSGGEVLIITPSGNIFSDWNKSLLQSDFLQYPFIRRLLATESSEDLFDETVNDQKMMINYIKSRYNGWKYVSVIPYKAITDQLDHIKQTTAAISLLLIFISLSAAILLSKRFFKVLQNIIDVIKNIGKITPQSTSKLDEFGLIRYYLESMQSQNESLEQQIKESMPLLRVSFIQSLLLEPPDPSDLTTKLYYYGIPVSCPFYTTICIELDNLRGQTERDSNLFIYAVINIAKEIISHHVEGMIFSIQSEKIAVIINHGSEQSPLQELQTEIFRISEEIRNVVERLLKITATIGIGHCYKGAENIHRSYKEALEAMQYQLVEGSGTVLFIDQVNPRLSAYTYPIEQEQQIMTNLKLGNLKQTRQMVDDFTAFLKNEQHFSYDHIRQSFIQLIAATLRTLYELDATEGPSLFSYNLYQHLYRFKTISQITWWLKFEVYPSVIDHTSKRRSQRHFETIEKVLSYIHQHYYEDLSQPLLAEMVHVPVSHFSQMFKKEVGMTFTDYIVAYRMEKAKELLSATSMKVAEIADQLRYNNSQNFIRMFKRFTGMTPGEYRVRHTTTIHKVKTEPS